jgi:hypothetical protein
MRCSSAIPPDDHSLLGSGTIGQSITAFRARKHVASLRTRMVPQAALAPEPRDSTGSGGTGSSQPPGGGAGYLGNGRTWLAIQLGNSAGNMFAAPGGTGVGGAQGSGTGGPTMPLPTDPTYLAGLLNNVSCAKATQQETTSQTNCNAALTNPSSLQQCIIIGGMSYWVTPSQCYLMHGRIAPCVAAANAQKAAEAACNTSIN